MYCRRFVVPRPFALITAAVVALGLLAGGVGQLAGIQAADKPAADPSVQPPVAWMLKPVETPDATAATESDMKPYTQKIIGTEVTFDMVPLPGGKFRMGSPDDEADRRDDEGPQFEAMIEPFWMGKHEVTWAEFELWSMGLDKQFRRVTGADMATAGWIGAVEGQRMLASAFLPMVRDQVPCRVAARRAIGDVGG